MLGLMVALALNAASPLSPHTTVIDGHPPEGAMHGLIKIFDMLCDQLFPDDSRMNNLDHVPNFRALTPQELKIYLKDDPGRGWITNANGSSIVVTVEAPPFHTCTVRMPHTDGQIDERLWRMVVEHEEAAQGGSFRPIPAQTIETEGMRQAVVGDTKQLPDGSAEAFYLFRTTVAEPARAPGYQTELRLVRQLTAAGADKASPESNAGAADFSKK